MSKGKEIDSSSGLTSLTNSFTDNDRTIALQMIKKGREQGRDIKAKLTPDNEILLVEKDKPLGLVNRKGLSTRDFVSLAPSVVVGAVLDLVTPEVALPYQVGKAVEYIPKFIKNRKLLGSMAKYGTGFGIAGAGEEAIANKTAGRKISDNVKDRAKNDAIAGAVAPIISKGVSGIYKYSKPAILRNKAISNMYNNYINAGGRKNITSLANSESEVNTLNKLHNSLRKKEIALPFNKTIDNLEKKNEEDFIKSLPIKLRKNNEVSIDDLYDAINGVKNTTDLAKNIGSKKITDAYNKFKELGEKAPIDYKLKRKAKDLVYPNNHINKIKNDLQSDYFTYNDNFKQGIANTPASHHVNNLVTTFGTDVGLRPNNIYDLEKHFRQNLTDIEGKLLADKETGAISQNDKAYIKGAKEVFDKRLSKIIKDSSDNPTKLKNSLLNARKTYHDIQNLLNPEDLTVDSDIINASNKLLNSNENTVDTYVKSLLNKNDRIGLGVYNQLYGKNGRVKTIIGKYGTAKEKQNILQLEDDIRKANFIGNMFKNDIRNTSRENFKPENLVDRKNVFLNSNYVKENFSKKEIEDIRNNFNKYLDTIDLKEVYENPHLIDDILETSSSFNVGSGNTGRLFKSAEGYFKGYRVRNALDKLLKKEKFTKDGFISRFINSLNKNNGKMTIPNIIISKDSED